jgi:hypothetical protein
MADKSEAVDAAPAQVFHRGEDVAGAVFNNSGRTTVAEIDAQRTYAMGC